MRYWFIGVEDNVAIERGEVNGLAYSKETGKYVEDKYRALSRLGGSKKKEDADEEEKDSTKRGDYENDSQEVMKGNDAVGRKGGHKGRSQQGVTEL